MSEKILSISVAAYNVEKYLVKLFEFLNISPEVNQKIDVIIVNDGSTDKTLEIANRFKSQYPQSVVIIDKKNGGYGSTINSSIAIAKGKYFKILDGDDWFNKNTLEDFLEFLENEEVDLVISPYEMHFENNNEIVLMDEHISESLTSPLLMHEICIKTALFRNSELRISEKCFYTDTEFAIIAMLLSKTFAKYNKPVYCYRIGREGQSISFESRKKHCNDSEHVVFKCINLIQNHNAKDAQMYLLIKKQIVKTAVFHFNTLLLFEKSKKSVSALKTYDRKLKSTNKEIYLLMSKTYNHVKVLRMTDYHMYNIIKKRKNLI